MLLQKGNWLIVLSVLYTFSAAYFKLFVEMEDCIMVLCLFIFLKKFSISILWNLF